MGPLHAWAWAEPIYCLLFYLNLFVLLYIKIITTENRYHLSTSTTLLSCVFIVLITTSDYVSAYEGRMVHSHYSSAKI